MSGAPPSNKYVAKMASIIAPSAIGGAGVSAALWSFFGKIGKDSGKSAFRVWRDFRLAKVLAEIDAEMTPEHVADLRLMEKQVFQAQAQGYLLPFGKVRTPILSDEQVEEVALYEHSSGESIWSDEV